MNMEKIRVEVEIEDREGAELIEMEGGNFATVLSQIEQLAAIGPLHVFERDGEQPIGPEIEKKKALLLVAHRCKEVLVKVQYENLTKEHAFPPSATVFRVLQWAIGKHAFELDDIARAKAHLMLTGATEPLANEMPIGRLVKFHHHEHHHELIVDLTMRDFTNG
jgi:hypothetical protein